MPAIDLARLKTQAARLADHYDQPEAFVRALQEMLELYTNRTMRSAQTVRRLSLPTYHTPGPVLRQVERELAPLANARPVEGVTLVNVLWKAGSLESRLLAARLLGMLPPSQAVSALTQLPDWLTQSTDKEIRQALLIDSFTRLRRENPEVFFFLLEEWLKSPRTVLQVGGLQALIPLLQDPHFENLPAVYRILHPAVQAAGPATQLEIQACLKALEQISLTETVIFLREIITTNPAPAFIRTLQRVLPALSPEMQTSLRKILREKGASKGTGK